MALFEDGEVWNHLRSCFQQFQVQHFYLSGKLDSTYVGCLKNVITWVEILAYSYSCAMPDICGLLLLLEAQLQRCQRPGGAN